MNLNTFKLEDYLSKYEFSAPYLLCCSDAESRTMQEILAMGSTAEMQLWNEMRLGYTEVRGLPVLRHTIAQELYPSLTNENIVCFAGAEEGIFCSLYALLEEKDHVIVLTPCYQSLHEIPRIRGCEITKIALQEENLWRIDPNAIAAAIRPNTKCVIINFPHNPTGQVISETELQQLISILDKQKIWLFADEVYRLLGDSNTEWSSPAAVSYDRAISLGVMSKAFGLAGLRVGWIACQDTALLKKIEQVKHYTSICNSAPSEILALITLNNKEQILQRNNDIVASNLSLIDSFFKRHNKLFSWVRPSGGCIGLVKYHNEEKIDNFCARLVEKTGVLLMPASIYELSTNHFRIGFGRSNMPQALEIFEGFLQ